MRSTVIVSGVPGVGKTTVLDELKLIAKDRGLLLQIVNFGSIMNEIFREGGQGIDRDEMRRQGLTKQKEIQEKAASRIADQAREAVVIVDTHMLVKTKDGFLPGLPNNVLAKLKPSLLVLIESSPDQIARRRRADPSRVRDPTLLDEISQDIAWSRSTAFACAVLTGAPLKIVKNDEGQQREAAVELLELLRDRRP